ncbi:phosphatase PAP2 family protein [Couchioplanes caeruleus]|uniref:Uncharacterized protein n=2 Tax=Couchioplanes caeruleus TaxID=56438 RepID=A0A1K0G7Y5_9ACTN|nr:phosphatase PAP2 family protein [Couchioplanes caeruleus]OJF13354.1 hypothetical protein BG844_15635 [Couchioplanes caeruleus subsp. caeruleus]ROP33568.1 PAP2 superfamily protein [Couchioplanes caeruleus]
MVVVLCVLGLLTVVPQRATAAPNYSGDPVHYWNGVLLELFRRVDEPPGKVTRAAAMLNIAVYDAESAYQRTWHTMVYQPYLGAPRYSGPPFLEGPDEEERVIGRTAYRMLTRLYPSQANFLENRFQNRFGTAPDAFDILDILVVNPVVQQTMNARADDGHDDPRPYSADGVPGAWRPTDSKCTAASQAATPFWGEVRPFAIPSGAHFRPPTPQLYASYDALLASPEYRTQVDEVRRLGGAASTERTVEQTAIGWFWANEVPGTYKPPGQLLEHTSIVAAQQRLTVYQNARLFALVSLALADAAIAEWDVKYLTPIDLWRPVSAIRDTGLDPNWQPLSADRNGVHFTPCFPAWASGHATFGGAWARVMRGFFNGVDAITFEATTEDPHSPVRTRRFTSFSQAAEENAQSRVYLGVHYSWDARDGLKLGDDVAGQVLATKLLKIT